jgi:hypothetical protein
VARVNFAVTDFEVFAYIFLLHLCHPPYFIVIMQGNGFNNYFVLGHRPARLDRP